MRRYLLQTCALAALCVALPVPSASAQERIDTRGNLQRGDSTLESGEWYDSYTIDVRAGDQIDVRAMSSAFDPYLIVRGPTDDVRWENDDEADGSVQARINETALVSGHYRVIVTSFRAGEAGSYEVRGGASRRSASAQPNSTPAAIRPVQPRQTGSGGGSAQQGTLAAGDEQLNSGEYVDTYQIDGRAGQRLQVTLSSTAFDTYVMLRGPDGSTFDNDDSEGEDTDGTNSALDVTLPANGTYRLMVTSYRSGETGGYSLSTNGPTILAAGGNRAGGRASGSAIGAATASDALVPGGSVSGQLASGDATLDSGEFFDTYTLNADPGTRLVLEMTSSAVDTYLAAFGAGDYQVSNDDDASGGNGTNSRLEVTVPETGTLTVAATSYAGGETGAYRLSAGYAGASARNQQAAPSQAMAWSGTISGELEQSDPRGDRSLNDVYTIEGEAGQALRLALTSDAFDPLVRVEGPDGFVAENDDDPAGGTLNALLDTTLPASGTYRVVVGSYATDGMGAYRLQSGTGTGQASTGGTQVASANAGDIALGQQLEASLAQGDQTISSGEFTDFYNFTGSRGQRVIFDMASADFDTYLSLQFPGGGQEDNDDRAGGETTDSRLVVTLPEDGEYRLMATSYQPEESGRYQISMAEPSVADGTLDPRVGSSRVFLLSVGVSDYERMNQLDLTDQDATKLTETMQRSGMLGSQSVTLVNAQATRANFEAAVADISRVIGPDDLFLVFFSGHGGKNQVDRSIEQDGVSETIEMFDTAIADYELSAMLEPISARTLLVLDSCFSGGFDDIINNRVGRMGVFSSDSDLTSLVADKFEAGGYISHILQLAMEGQADANGDTTITAGELSEFMRTTFYRIALSEPLESDWYDTARGHSGSGYQHIVVNRGGDGMPYEEVLVNLTAASR
ncbi:MAG: pre-peptidase C-terminal domain-containing protein [Pseudomonadota bacterium]